MCIINFNNSFEIEKNSKLEYLANKYGYDGYFPSTFIPCKILDFSSICHHYMKRDENFLEQFNQLNEDEKKHLIPDNELEAYGKIVSYNLSVIANAHAEGCQLMYPINKEKI